MGSTTVTGLGATTLGAGVDLAAGDFLAGVAFLTGAATAFLTDSGFFLLAADTLPASFLATTTGAATFAAAPFFPTGAAATGAATTAAALPPFFFSGAAATTTGAGAYTPFLASAPLVSWAVAGLFFPTSFSAGWAAPAAASAAVAALTVS